MEKWKSKIRIPTFPPPRMPAAQGKNGRLHKTLDTSLVRPSPDTKRSSSPLGQCGSVAAIRLDFERIAPSTHRQAHRHHPLRRADAWRRVRENARPARSKLNQLAHALL